MGFYTQQIHIEAEGRERGIRRYFCIYIPI